MAQPVTVTPSLTRVDTARGSYYKEGENVRMLAGLPATPRLTQSVADAAKGQAHGAFLESASYTDVSGFTPLLPQARNDTNDRQPPPTKYVYKGWTPARTGLVSRTQLKSGADDTLTVLPEQYRRATDTQGTARVYSGLTYTIYYNTSGAADRRVPVVRGVDVTSGAQVAVTMYQGGSLPQIARVGATWTTGNGHWQTTDLTYDAASATWKGTLPVSGAADFFVQALDVLGNVGQADNAGLYYQAAASAAVTLTPPSGAPGTSVTVAGAGFIPQESVTVHWDGNGSGSNCAAAGMLLATVSADSSGAFSVTITVPSCASRGSHPALATGAQTATASFIVLNRPPTAANDSRVMAQGQAVTLNVLANDADPDGDALTVTITAPPARGTAVVNANGSITYTPSPGTLGNDTLTYQAADGQGGTATATAKVVVIRPDVNGNGVVSTADAVCLKRSLAGLPATSGCPAATFQGDVDGNGVVGVTDVVLLLRYLVGL